MPKKLTTYDLLNIKDDIVNNNSVFLTITVYPYLLNNWPKIISWLPFVFYIKPKLENYLNSVIGGINWYLINNKPVPKNYFGIHSWFSKIKP